MRATRESLALIVFLGGCASGPAATERIARLEQQRAGAERITPWLAVHDAKVNARALRALAQLQDPSSLDAIGKMLPTLDPAVRREALFAIAQLGLGWEPLVEEVRARAEALLLRNVRWHELDREPELFDAVGAVAGEAGVHFLVEQMVSGEAASSNAAGRALGNWLHRNKKKGWPGTPPRLGLDGEWGRGIAYALMRAASPDLGARTAHGLHAEDAEVRALAARGMAALKAFDSSMQGMTAPGGDLRVRIEAIKALAAAGATTEKPAGENAFVTALVAAAEDVVAGHSESNQVVWAALEAPFPPALLDAPGRVVEELLRKARLDEEKAARPDTVRLADLARLECEAAAAVDRAAGRVALLEGCGGAHLAADARQRRIARALGSGEFAGRMDALERLAHSLNAGVRALAVESLGKVGQREAHREAATARVREALADPDGPVVANAAEAAALLGDAKAGAALGQALARFTADADVEIVSNLVDAIAALKVTEAIPALRERRSSTNAAVRLAAKKALVALGADPGSEQHPTLPTPHALGPPAEARLRVVTDKGTFVITLARGDAPVTTSVLVKLARERFFDGLTFHRVVPGFVAQGGDPRGDGWGGPGFLVPCEISPRHYRRGTVGMALAGKDTAGSQFFVTYADTPHLDGRYPIVGEVSAGMEVVDRLLPGDRMVSVTAE